MPLQDPPNIQQRLTLSTMKGLDFGALEEAFNRELSRLVKDCDERPLDDKPRTLTLAVKMIPKADTSGRNVVCDNIDVELEIVGKVPVTRSKIFTMKPKHDGALMFHPDLPDMPEGHGLYDHDHPNAKGQQ